MAGHAACSSVAWRARSTGGRGSSRSFHATGRSRWRRASDSARVDSARVRVRSQPRSARCAPCCSPALSPASIDCSQPSGCGQNSWRPGGKSCRMRCPSRRSAQDKSECLMQKLKSAARAWDVNASGLFAQACLRSLFGVDARVEASRLSPPVFASLAHLPCSRTPALFSLASQETRATLVYKRYSVHCGSGRWAWDCVLSCHAQSPPYTDYYLFLKIQSFVHVCKIQSFAHVCKSSAGA